MQQQQRPAGFDIRFTLNDMQAIARSLQSRTEVTAMTHSKWHHFIEPRGKRNCRHTTASV